MASIGPVSLLEVREVLSERLTLLPQRPSGDRYGKVWVAPIEAARGMSFEMVLVPGLAERMFPRKIIEDPLLLDSFRLRLDAGLPLQKDRIAKERLLLRLAIGAASGKIVFSYPSIDLAKGRAKVPSFYLLEVARASQGELPDFETLAREAASSSGARLGWPAPRDRARPSTPPSSTSRFSRTRSAAIGRRETSQEAGAIWSRSIPRSRALSAPDTSAGSPGTSRPRTVFSRRPKAREGDPRAAPARSTRLLRHRPREVRRLPVPVLSQRHPPHPPAGDGGSGDPPRPAHQGKHPARGAVRDLETARRGRPPSRHRREPRRGAAALRSRVRRGRGALRGRPRARHRAHLEGRARAHPLRPPRLAAARSRPRTTASSPTGGSSRSA